MTKEELRASYQKQIEQANTELEKGLLRAELNHKLRNLGKDFKKEREASQFECIGCGS